MGRLGGRVLGAGEHGGHLVPELRHLGTRLAVTLITGGLHLGLDVGQQLFAVAALHHLRRNTGMAAGVSGAG